MRNKPPPLKKGVTTSKKEKKGIPWPYMVLIAAVMAVIAYFVHMEYFAYSHLLKKLPPIKMEVEKNKWGTYRSNTYFGLRMRDPKSPLFGMMWYEQPSQPIMPNVRHWCDQGDNLNSYAWTSADGRSFGIQSVNDSSGQQLETTWLGHEDTFSSKIKGFRKIGKNKRTTVILYMVKQDAQMSLSASDPENGDFKSIFTGHSSKLGDFTVDLQIKSKFLGGTALSIAGKVDLARLNDLVLMHTVAAESDHGIVYQLNQKDPVAPGNANFVAVQLNLPSEFELEIYFNSQNHTSISGALYDKTLNVRLQNFEERFENAFEISNKGYTPSQMKVGRIALSNMLGGIGYWYGYNKVALPGQSELVPYGPHALFSAVPSRPFFPRGFLWDEGFHNMLIRKFDSKLSLEILVSWLNTMTEDGWIPREMILGPEAEAKVPSEYIAQRTNVANPPSFFYVIEKMVDDKEFVKEHASILSQMYPKLVRWYNWLRNSQKGHLKGTFRWRGRNATIDTELNPKTLASGLDDYPRASHPNSEEYHLDLRCWMAICSRVVSKLASLYGTDVDKKRYGNNAEADANFDDILKKHWSESAKVFADYGKHSSEVVLRRVLIQKKGKQGGEWVWKRVVIQPPHLGLVDDVFGYNSLYPLIARVVPPNSEYMRHILEKLSDEKELWTDFGLRSLSKQSPYYAAKNTEHDPPYWRGYIWMNINYLTLSALKHYSEIPGDLQARTKEIFEQLRHNLVDNIAKQFTETGYVYENYDDITGEGRGCKPFNGWSSLILMIMSDQLDG